MSGVRFGFKKKIDSLSESSVHDLYIPFYVLAYLQYVLSFKVLIELKDTLKISLTFLL